MEKSDRDLPGITYALHCDSAAGVAKEPVMGEIVAGADETIKFAGEKIADGDNCALEIRIPAPTGADAESYTWHSKPDDRKVGLLYGSSRGKVAGRKLALTLYTLYTRNEGPQFLADIDVAFELPAGAKIPAAASASLLCNNNKNYATSVYKASGDKEGTYSFKLPVADMKGVACSTFTVLEAAKAVYEGALDIAVFKFAEPKKDEVVKFGTRVKLIEKKTDSVTTDIAAGKCVNYDAAKLNCLDLRTVTLPRAKNFWAARVQTRVKANEVVSLFVGSAGNGNVLDATGNTKTVVDFNKSLAKNASAADKVLFSWFNTSIYPEFQKVEWNKNMASNSVLRDGVAKREAIEGLEMSHIESLWIHGFKEVSEANLNKAESARWIAVVKATNGTASAEFIVTGADDYFASATRPATDKFFSWDAIKADRDAKSGKYKVYAIKAGAFATATCTVDKAFFIDELSGKYDDEMKPASATAGRIAEVDQCLVGNDKFTKDYDTWSVAPTLYQWGWHEVK